MFDPNKYVVKKKDGTPLESGTYFVIRDTDLLGVATLRSYQSNIGIAIDMHNLGGGVMITQEQENYLGDLAGGVDDLARQWENKNGSRSLPD